MPYGQAARREADQLASRGTFASPQSEEVSNGSVGTITEVVDLPKLGRQVMVFDAQRNLLSVNGRAVMGGVQ